MNAIHRDALQGTITGPGWLRHELFLEPEV
jgi:hypothetical protein